MNYVIHLIIFGKGYSNLCTILLRNDLYGQIFVICIFAPLQIRLMIAFRKDFLVLLLVALPLIMSGLAPFSVHNGTQQRIFHIERSKNKNIVCYDANILVTRKLNQEDPIHAYWINQTDHPGERSDLSFIQNKMAYGYSYSKNADGSIEVSLVPLPARKLTVFVDAKGQVHGKIMISGKASYISKIYVQADPSNSLKVQYVDIFGTEIATGKAITERILNDK